MIGARVGGETLLPALGAKTLLLALCLRQFACLFGSFYSSGSNSARHGIGFPDPDPMPKPPEAPQKSSLRFNMPESPSVGGATGRRATHDGRRASCKEDSGGYSGQAHRFPRLKLSRSRLLRESRRTFFVSNRVSAQAPLSARGAAHRFQ
jgi:hypothetical protein